MRIANRNDILGLGEMLLPLVIVFIYCRGNYINNLEDMTHGTFSTTQMVMPFVIILLYEMWRRLPWRGWVLLVLAYYLQAVLSGVTLLGSRELPMWSALLFAAWPVLLNLLADAADRVAERISISAEAVFFIGVFLAVSVMTAGQWTFDIREWWNGGIEAIEKLVYDIVMADIVWHWHVQNHAGQRPRRQFPHMLVANLIMIAILILPNHQFLDIMKNIGSWGSYCRMAVKAYLSGNTEGLELSQPAFYHDAGYPGASGLLTVRLERGWPPVIAMSICLLLLIFSIYHWRDEVTGERSRYFKSIAAGYLFRMIMVGGLDVLMVMDKYDAFPMTGNFLFEAIVPYICEAWQLDVFPVKQQAGAWRLTWWGIPLGRNRNNAEGTGRASGQMEEQIPEQMPDCVSGQIPASVSAQVSDQDPQKLRFSVPYTYGIRSRDATVELRNASGSIRHVIVDAQGKILKSKGVAHPAVIRPYLTENGCMNDIVHYMADFEERDGRFLMLWEIQPDGRYWEDEDGFGGEPDYEIRLYAWLDENGEFDGAFRVYSIGSTQWFGTDMEERKVEELRLRREREAAVAAASGKTQEELIRDQIEGGTDVLAQVGWPVVYKFAVHGTDYIAYLSVREADSGLWRLIVGVTKGDSDRLTSHYLHKFREDMLREFFRKREETETIFDSLKTLCKL